MPSLGATFAHYRIEAVLGKGGMGQVYLAFDERLHRQVALKVLLTSEPADAQRMVREARAAAAVEHPNKVTIYELGEAEGAPYIAMELIRGPTLRALVDDPETTWQTAVSHLIDVARALEAAHAAGLVHRDVKPENVMVREDGVVKVLDFGIARRSVSAIDPTAPTATATEGLIMGTASYMPPEQVRGEKLDGRCDEFAWAVMAFELLTGEHPWGHGGDAVRLMSTMLTKPPRRVVDLRPQVPPALSAIVARGLSPERDDRFPSMRAVVDELAAVLGGGERASAELAVKAHGASGVAARPADLSPPSAATTTGAVSAREPERPGSTAPVARRGAGAKARWIIPVALLGVAAAALGAREVAGRWPRGAALAGDAGVVAAAPSAAPTGSTAEPHVKAPSRYRCHTDVQEHGVVPCGPNSFQWCDADARKIACCADGLVAAGHDGMCECPPLSNEAGRARGCVDSPKAKPFLPQDVAALLREGRKRVRACFDEGAGHERTSRLRFLVDFSPEGPTAAVRILRSDSPDPAKQACALRELRSLEGWAARGGAAAWEMDWDVGAPSPALAAARAAAAQDGGGYGYEYSVDPVKTTAPPLYDWPIGKNGRLDPMPIQNRMRRGFPAMSACTTASADKSAGPFVGRIIPEFIIGEDGRVVDIQLDGSDVADATIVSCVLAEVAKVVFPASHFGVITVVYPLAFGPGAAE